jgi:hypothetical protein
MILPSNYSQSSDRLLAGGKAAARSWQTRPALTRTCTTQKRSPRWPRAIDGPPPSLKVDRALSKTPSGAPRRAGRRLVGLEPRLEVLHEAVPRSGGTRHRSRRPGGLLGRSPLALGSCVPPAQTQQNMLAAQLRDDLFGRGCGAIEAGQHGHDSFHIGRAVVDIESDLCWPLASSVGVRIPPRLRPRRPTKPHKRARALVRRAHPLYTELVGAVRHDANGYNQRIHTITKHRHNDAANTIADLILQLR